LRFSARQCDRAITNFIDDALARRKLNRRIALLAPFLSAVRILSRSDAVVVLPQRSAHELAGYRPLVLRDLPFASPEVQTGMIWPRWPDHQPAYRWLRDNVERAAKDLA
jgi:DNA-binding transcriptional LysR family regulator